jgi:hypothetical protein
MPKEFDEDIEPKRIDAIVHFAAIARLLVTTDNEVFRIAVMGTYNIFDAASKYGIRKVIVASSETTYGAVFARTAMPHRSHQRSHGEGVSCAHGSGHLLPSHWPRACPRAEKISSHSVCARHYANAWRVVLTNQSDASFMALQAIAKRFHSSASHPPLRPGLSSPIH